MGYDYVDNFSDEERWEVMKLVLASGKYEQILSLLDDGYRVTGPLLECLYRLGQKGIIDQILERSYRFASNTYGFLMMYTASASVEELNANIRAREKKRKTREYEEKQKKREAENERLEKEWRSVVALGLVSETFEYVQVHNCWGRLFKEFGTDAVVEAVGDDKRYIDGLKRALPSEFWYKKGDFSRLSADYHLVEGYEVESEAFLDMVLRIAGGAEALYGLKEKTADRELVKRGYKHLFVQDGVVGCRRLARVKALTMEDLRNLYRSNPKAVKKFIRYYGSFKQKAALFFGRLN